MASSVPALALAGDCERTLAQAQTAFDARRFEAAAAGLERALSDCPERLDVRVSLSQVQYLLGEEPEAEETLLAALRRDGKFVPALYSLGRVYYQQKRFAEAVAQFRRVVEIEPGHYRAWDNLGLSHDALHQDAEALGSFFRALDLVMKDHPGYDWAHANLADYFLRRNQFEKAFQLAAEASKRNSGSARNFFLTGKALTKLGKEDLSLRWLERAAELDPSYSEAHYLLSQVYRKLNRPDDSRRALERFRELSRKPRPRR